MHLKRWLTAIIALPILIYIIGFCPRWIFYSLLCLISLAGLNEFYRLVIPDLHLFIKVIISLLTLLFFFLMFRDILLAFVLFSLMMFIPMLFFLFSNPLEGEVISSNIGKTVLGPLYVCLPLALLIHIDKLSLINQIDRFGYTGQNIYGIWIFFLLAIIFANDTGAFYSGKLFGKHKLYEAVSPKKTWEGSIGGILLAIIIATFFLKILGPHPVDIKLLLIVILVSVAGQIGDLVESMLKRNHNVKDSGALLPGHGGILDRIDSLLFAAPVLYIFLTITIK